MRKTIIKAVCLFVLLASNVSAYSQFTIQGKVDNVNNGKVYLSIHGQNVDSALVDHGKFELKSKKLDAPKYVTVSSADNKYGTMFWAYEGKMKLHFGSNNVELKGSKTEDEYKIYTGWMNQIWKERRAFANREKELQLNGKNHERDSLVKTLGASLILKEDSIFMNFARKYPRSYISLNHIYNSRLVSKYPFKRYSKMFALLDSTAFSGKQYEVFMEYYHNDLNLEPGHVFPDISLPNAFNNTIKVSDFRGKYLLFSIAASWVSDYNEDNVVKKELYSNLHAKGFEVMDMLLDESKDKMIKLIANSKLKWSVVSDCKGWGSPILNPMSIDHISQTFLIGPDGVIIERDIHGASLKECVEKYIK